MQRWEYLNVVTTTIAGGRLLFINNKQVDLKPNWGNLEFLDCINNLGEEGWELVTHVTTYTGTNQVDVYTFKRQKP
jgi:hypothetical protein